jgi:hypothetical protein
MQLDRSLSAPAQHGVARELRAVIEEDCLREPAFKSEILETANDVVAPKRKPNFQGKAFAGEIINDHDRTNISAVR